MAQSRPVAEWRALAREVVIDVLEKRHAVTHRELEAVASDFTWDIHICPAAINPHHLTHAVIELIADGIVEVTQATTRGGKNSAGLQLNTLAFTRSHKPRGRRSIDDAAARKRILTARHQGWSTRGGRGNLGLIGSAGETAMAQALHDAKRFANIQANVTTLLGTPLVGEIDLACVHVDDEMKAILVLIEVKNTREWYYDVEATNTTTGAVNRFLRKAAHLQHHHPNINIAPLFVARKAHATLIDLGNEHGFLVASTRDQLVKSDNEITLENFSEVRDELYRDIALDKDTTNFHRGIAAKMIPKSVSDTASTWQENHIEYLHPADRKQTPSQPYDVLEF